jgi:hypothetical protein
MLVVLIWDASDIFTSHVGDYYIWTVSDIREYQHHDKTWILVKEAFSAEVQSPLHHDKLHVVLAGRDAASVFCLESPNCRDEY